MDAGDARVVTCRFGTAVQKAVPGSAFRPPSFRSPTKMLDLRASALAVLLADVADLKASVALALDVAAPVDSAAPAEQVNRTIPGRPPKPVLVPHTQLTQRSMRTVEGRAALLHALAHIELNAIDLAADIVWRFSDMPDEFYRHWAQVAKEEAYHFSLLRDHLRALGYEYGDFPAHDALWQMAEKTKWDVLARLALVPRTLEARGLDASPAVKAKLVGAGDLRAGEIIDIILRDEIGHVAVGNQWYRWTCGQRGLDPITAYPELARQYGAPRLRGPFNLEARRLAGFDEQELRDLLCN